MPATNPGKINFGFGQGTLPHMLGETLKHTAKIDITSVPYKGGAQAVADMLGGHIQMNFGTTATLFALIKQGKLRALAVTNDTRLAEIPDVPTRGGKRLSESHAALLDGAVGAAAHARRASSTSSTRMWSPVSNRRSSKPAWPRPASSRCRWMRRPSRHSSRPSRRSGSRSRRTSGVKGD